MAAASMPLVSIHLAATPANALLVSVATDLLVQVNNFESFFLFETCIFELTFSKWATYVGIKQQFLMNIVICSG